MNTPDQEYPTYNVRTVTHPDGTRIGITHKPGTLDNVTDEELLAENARLLADLHAGKLTEIPLDGPAARPDANVRSLAIARLRKHPPGEPLTPELVAPLLNDPTDAEFAAEFTAAINYGIRRALGREEP
ncbi:hypothetical protein [Streptomyces sp. NPDC059783]|uniref:hypothetical protein n=1 Tax=Streptomyces sp. NPDC059783 TaxID=3346944 RepID=UPI00365B998A